MEYSSEVRRRFESPGGAGEFDARAPGLAVAGEAEDRALNIWVRFEVEVVDAVIREARFRVYGCPHTIAAASWAAEWLRGRSADALSGLDVQRVRQELALPTEKLGKILRIEDALAACRDRLEAAGVAAVHTEGISKWQCP